MALGVHVHPPGTVPVPRTIPLSPSAPQLCQLFQPPHSLYTHDKGSRAKITFKVKTEKQR